MKACLARNRDPILYGCGMVLGLLALSMSPAFAQAADGIGMSTINTQYLLIAKVVAAMAATTVALLCMTGKHPMSAIIPVLGGGLAVGKMATILGWMGLT